MNHKDHSDTAQRRIPSSLLVVIIVALCARIGWWFAFVDVIDNEGAEYARLGQSLIAGHGMIGIFGGRSIMFPPLFPALIGLFSLLTGNVETAGRVVNLVCGTALVGVLYVLALHLFNARTAIVVGVLAAIHPLLVALSVSTYSECLWIFLVISSLYLVVRSLKTESKTQVTIAGLAVGLSYLARPEGMAFFAFLAVALFSTMLIQRCKPTVTMRQTGLFLAAGLIVILPYVIYLSSLAGSFHWEGKSVYNNIQNERLRAGMTVPQAARGLDAQGNPVGIFLSLHLDQKQLLRQPVPSSESLLKTLTTNTIPRTKNIIYKILTLRFLSAPWIFAPILIGVGFAAWWHKCLWEGLIVLAVLPIQGILLLSIDLGWDRYYFTLVPLLILWASAGLVWLAEIFSRRTVKQNGIEQSTLSVGIALLGGLLLSSAAYSGVRSVGELEQAGDKVGKEIGQWIALDASTRHIAGRPDVMAITLSSVFYADGTLRYLPTADEEATLGYVHRIQPHYIVLRDFELRQTPYAKAWLERGISDKCAIPVKAKWSRQNDASKIWRWACSSEETDSEPAVTPR